MDNQSIADQFTLLSKLMDIHQENPFKVKSYASAAYAIEQIKSPLAEFDRRQLAELRGIGASTAGKIIEILDTGTMQVLTDLIHNTPPGVIEMLQVKGLGPKKISTIWKELAIESIGELLYACQENRLMLYKGFGAKTQENVRLAIEFLLSHKHQSLYASVVGFAKEIQTFLTASWPDEKHSITGAFRRQSPVIEKIEWLTTTPMDDLCTRLNALHVETEKGEGNILANYPDQIPVVFHHSDEACFAKTLFLTTGHENFVNAWREAIGEIPNMAQEEDIFENASMPAIPPCLREDAAIVKAAMGNTIPQLIQPSDVKGIIHAHSTWSDGSHSLEEMAEACRGLGYEYLVISDHSRSAQYAGGLDIARIQSQHAAIDALNQSMHPFKIFKSIESDILSDGSLDYPDDILASFDLVIASVHSNLKMSEEKSMARLLRAIANPYTTILGHPTGRLLLSRPGYPVDHKAMLDACAKAGVAVEINAHPRRLDLDWSWIPYAMGKQIMLSVNPDAHSLSGMADVRFGILAAQKGGLTKAFNLSSLSRDELQAYLEKRKAGRLHA